jgi:hypothetical protein
LPGAVSGPSFSGTSSFCGVALMLLAMSLHGRRLWPMGSCSYE